MAIRRQLTQSDLADFKEWLVKHEWVIENTKGPYEVLRARKPGRDAPLILFKKKNKYDLTFMDKDSDVLNEYIRDVCSDENEQHCRTCDLETVCEMPDFVWSNMKSCKCHIPKKGFTVGDQIRRLPDEQLAKLLEKAEAAGYNDCSITPILPNGYHMNMLDYIQSPAEPGGLKL